MTPAKFMATSALVLAFACPAAAQQAPQPPADYYRTNPTPEEVSQTSSLNQKQAAMGGVTASGETGSAVAAHAEDVQRAYQAALDAYHRQMDEYHRKYGSSQATGAYAPAR